MPVLCLKSLADRYLKAMSLGTVPPPSGHNITPETLKLCVAMVEGTQRNVILTDEM